MGVNRSRLALILVLLAVLCGVVLGAGITLLIIGGYGTLAIVLVLLGGWGAAGALFGVDV
jgi:hypothetical protein